MNISAVSAPSGLHAVSGASTGAPPQQKMSNLFNSIDTSGSGNITQSQFEQAFQTKNPPAAFQQQGAAAILRHSIQRHRERIQTGFCLDHVRLDGFAPCR